MGGVYILHFDEVVEYARYKNYGDRKHYVGFTADFSHRLRAHADEGGSAYTKAAAEQGIGFQVGRLYYGGTKKDESRFIKNPRLYCSICNDKLGSHV